jgi:hypothetical protein
LAEPQYAQPVKLLAAVLWAGVLEPAFSAMREFWGEMDFIGPDHLFEITHYYDKEMGPGLNRRLISFARLISPETIRCAKLICNDIEQKLAGECGRSINLDIGYLDHNKIVLASAKGAGQRIYLGDGIWADLVGRYRAGRYQPFEWTFPDFRDGRYDRELAVIRRRYLEQMRDKGAEGAGHPCFAQ